MHELAIQKAIRERGLDAVVDEFSLKVREEGDLVQLNYNQIDSPRGVVEADECRGLILRRDTWEVVAHSFTRFFNLGESEADVPTDLQRCVLLEKMDGCCREDVVLVTEDGEKTIREVCESQYRGKVLSYDVETFKVEYDEVVGHSVRGESADWFDVELEDGRNIALTGNHRVWLPVYRCYR